MNLCNPNKKNILSKVIDLQCCKKYLTFLISSLFVCKLFQIFKKTNNKKDNQSKHKVLILNDNHIFLSKIIIS